ncbi:hypothetical protein CPSG_09689 [Coccidioides posadasii str. Silveira]|uniref:Uncharacterized protein n=1 Tax=Coccidioides posadasii (strain RMSCC 757 / Silveira) TaxID=443226 RepID=E9DIP6_COCPS|nr:hypothetical protein CPSG_09689 [Coccidioides posadasii str. Silveira]
MLPAWLDTEEIETMVASSPATVHGTQFAAAQSRRLRSYCTIIESCSLPGTQCSSLLRLPRIANESPPRNFLWFWFAMPLAGNMLALQMSSEYQGITSTVRAYSRTKRTREISISTCGTLMVTVKKVNGDAMENSETQMN